MKWIALSAALIISGMSTCATVSAQEKIELADGKISLTAPQGWEKQQPRTRIVEAEYAVPAKKAETDAGRLTIMGAGGGVEANIDRWYGQFSQPDGKETSKVAKRDKLEVDGTTVHWVDISGTFKDQRGPFAPATMREDYRMLGAIIETPGAGMYFIKLTGPAETLTENEDEFKALVKSLKVTK